MGKSAKLSCRFQRRRYSVYLLYWYKSTNTDTAKRTPALQRETAAERLRLATELRELKVLSLLALLVQKYKH